jgi:NAD(P)-dependent dehydrogenase (short-subunit alcohol dehydrogenase family)
MGNKGKGAVMARVLDTGSADGLGLMAAVILVGQGHAVTLHARNDSRAGDARTALPLAESVVVGDLTTIAGMRQVYLSSGMHRSGQASLSDPQWTQRLWSGAQAYSDSKLFDTVLAFAVARHWPTVLSNALEPGWVPTKMGGPGAPDDLSLAPVTQAWLAVSDDPPARVTAGYFYHQRPREVHPAARDTAFQDELLDYCATLTGVVLPAPAAQPQ